MTIGAIVSRSAGDEGSELLAAGAAEHVDGPDPEVLHDEAIPGRRTTEVPDVGVQRRQQLCVFLANAERDRLRRTQEHAELYVRVFVLRGQRELDALDGAVTAPERMSPSSADWSMILRFAGGTPAAFAAST
jgi:hypothetical protein